MVHWRRLLALYGLGCVRPKRSLAAWVLCALSLMASSLTADIVLPGIAAAAAFNGPGIITTLAGTGARAYTGDGGPATAAKLNGPTGIAVDQLGNVYMSEDGEVGAARVRRVSPTGIITTVAGNGVQGFSGDGGPATAAQLFMPRGLAVDAAGNLLIADFGNNRVRRVSTSGIITTVAGNGVPGFSGDGGAATAAQLSLPYAVAVDAAANIVFTDLNNRRVRRVSPSGIVALLTLM